MIDHKYRARKRKRFNIGTTYENVIFEWIEYFPNEGLPELNDGENWMYGQVERQYTGLKDRNGVEIYEGDICVEENGIKSTIDHVWSIWLFNGQALTGITEGDKLGYYGGDIEVIGNIYENPEVLK